VLHLVTEALTYCLLYMTEIFENIRKFYFFHYPEGELSRYIEFISESAVDLTRDALQDNSFSIRMFPSWAPTCYINLGMPYRILAGKKTYFVAAEEDICVLRNGIVERFNSPCDHILTIKFKLGGTEALLAKPVSLVPDRPTGLSFIMPSTLIQSVKNATCFKERIAILESFFFNRITENFREKAVRDAINIYQASGFTLYNEELAERLCLTLKTFNRYFLHVAGVAPKFYLANLRARTALTDYVTERPSFIASKYGYFDAAHFYRDIRLLAGSKLSDFYNHSRLKASFFAS